MNIPVTFGVVLLTSLTLLQAADEFDFTKRAVTDPLLKISTSTSLLPAKDDAWLGGKRDEKHVPPVYRSLWQQSDVIMLEPFSKERPAEIDFSAVTEKAKGVLRLAVRNHPSGDCIAEVVKDGQTVEKETIDGDRWKKFQIPFDHEKVVLKNVANNWAFEFLFVDYSIGRNP